ncbi:DUF1206 domain-containing protein [Streptomyces sp. TRM 70351]|uniref:DUF1206 domain-containing protein n=1 Tax=Streptomyces sp. TRM 70351 TaxID=3116552 RepID=UPI002E7C28F1|nr:DUF1206 domain-containing protein [Streptomyces sp. TRM 70351]MEE1930166.1 DUF1206 domain-containing protein [Streptomyces sp. TRM 70351]
MSMGIAARRGRSAARRTAHSSAMDIAARWGLAARGVLYVLIGLLALQIAFGQSGEQADQNGALQTVSQQPFGQFVVWAIGIGLIGMALWRLSEALFGASTPDGHKASKRAISGLRFVIYAFLAFSVLRFATGSGSSGEQQSSDITARALELPAGQWIVGLAGAAVIAGGLYIAVKAVRRKFREELKMSQMSRRARKTVDFLGVAGGACRGAVFMAAGWFVVQAALTYDADETKGMDQVLRSFADTPVGPWLLVAIAVGLALFGAFSLAMARWHKV